MADLSKIPLVALSIDTKILVSNLLNPMKWLLTENGLPRDWRGLAHLCELEGEIIPSLAGHQDPTGQLLTLVENKKPSISVHDFLSILSRIDRYDILDDSRSLIERDARIYAERIERCEESANAIDTETERNILTIDDSYRLENGLEKQFYDAFVLYADEDLQFVEEMIDVLEKKNCLKLCLKDRDLMGGIPFEHEAVMRLISERCNRLIVVVSPDFLKSPANAFFLNFAQAVGIGTGQRKIIPCLYKKCQLPPQLAYQFILDYGKKGLYDFWGRLYACVRVVAEDNSAKSALPTQRPSLPTADNLPSEKTEKSAEKNFSRSETNWDCLKKIDGASSTTDDGRKLSKMKKKKKFVVWPKKKRDQKYFGADKIEPETMSISLSLPSLDNLSSLETTETTTRVEKEKRKKNLVGTCVTKVQSLLSKN